MPELFDQQYLLLSQFAYVKATVDPDKFQDYVDKGWTLKDIIGVKGEYNNDTILGSPDGKIIDNNGCMTTSEFVDVLTAIAGDKELGNLKLKAYQNENNSSGMVAYAFEDNSGNAYIAFTGTEGLPAQGKTGCDLLSEDWINNYRTGLDNMSCQFEPSREFVEKYKSPNGKNYITGHSQGGANAMYACASVEGCTGKVFDGTGISQLLSSEQRERLVQSGLINYVAKNDIVGPLFFHSEKRIFVEESKDYFRYMSPDKNHYTQALMFDGGKAIEAPRTGMSKIIEKLTQRYYIYNTLTGSGTKHILNAYEGYNTGSDNVGYRIWKYSEATMDLKDGLTKLPLDIMVLITSLVDNIGEISVESVEGKYGLVAELAYTCSLASVCPALFSDDFLKALKENSIVLLKKVIAEFKKAGTAIINILHDIGNKMIEIKDSLGNALCKLAIEVKKAWGKLVTYITGIYNDIINTGKIIVEEIGDLVNKTRNAISNFFIAVSNRMKSFYDMLVYEINRTIENVIQNINNTINTAKSEIKHQYNNFKNRIRYLSEYANKTLKGMGEKGTNFLKQFGKKVLVGNGTFMSARLCVDLIRLEELQRKLRRLEYYFEEQIEFILREANKAISGVDRKYNEHYVQNQIQNVDRSRDQVRKTGRRVCDLLQRKINSLKYALEQYQAEERLLRREIQMNLF